jgi:ubiquinone/menaquinone biosynthesis C-methylase UbiE
MRRTAGESAGGGRNREQSENEAATAPRLLELMQLPAPAANIAPGGSSVTHRVTFESILAQPGLVRELGAGLYSALPASAIAAPYDRRATAYDAVVGRSIYHRIFWGTSAPAYARFARAALDAAGDGCLAEAGCGSLLFTSAIYRTPCDAFVVLMDRSIQMLRRGLNRVSMNHGRPPESVAFLHSDAATMPVRPGVFSSILCLNVLHVPCDVEAIAAEFSRTLMPGRGRLFVSALVRSDRWSDNYMSVLHRIGELAAPLTPDELRARVAGRWGVVESTKVEGNMCFLVVRHAS